MNVPPGPSSRQASKLPGNGARGELSTAGARDNQSMPMNVSGWCHDAGRSTATGWRVHSHMFSDTLALQRWGLTLSSSPSSTYNISALKRLKISRPLSYSVELCTCITPTMSEEESQLTSLNVTWIKHKYTSTVSISASVTSVDLHKRCWLFTNEDNNPPWSRATHIFCLFWLRDSWRQD